MIDSCNSCNSCSPNYFCHVAIRGQVIKSDVIVLEQKTPTAIETIDAAKKAHVVKTVKNGRVVVIRGDEQFDLAGRKL